MRTAGRCRPSVPADMIVGDDRGLRPAVGANDRDRRRRPGVERLHGAGAAALNGEQAEWLHPCRADRVELSTVRAQTVDIRPVPTGTIIPRRLTARFSVPPPSGENNDGVMRPPAVGRAQWTLGRQPSSSGPVTFTSGTSATTRRGRTVRDPRLPDVRRVQRDPDRDERTRLQRSHGQRPWIRRMTCGAFCSPPHRA